MANVLLMVKGSEGDVFPFIRIGQELQTRQHTVTLFTHCYYEAAVRQAGINFTALDTPDLLAQMLKDQQLFVDPAQLATYYRRHILPRIPSEYEMIAAQCETADTILVSHYNLQLTAQLVSEVFGVPLTLVFLTPTQVINLPLLGQLLRVLADDLNPIRAAVGLPSVQNWETWLRSVKQSIALWPAWFAAPEASWPPGVTPVDFISRAAEPGDLPGEIETMLDAEAPPILITGGTGVWALEAEFYAAGAAACGALNQRGLLVTRRKELIPASLPAEVKWAEYLPFTRLLPRLKAIIHHGGIGTCIQALAAGVPQLILAAGFDRPDNAGRLQRLGVAEFLPPAQWQPETVAQALQQISSSTAIKARCQEIAARMRATDSTAEVCKLIEAELARGRHHAQSRPERGARLKILLVQNLLYVPTHGGANKCDRLLLEGLAAQGHRCRVVAPATSVQGLETHTQFLAELAQRGIQPISYPDVDVFQLNGVEVHAVKDSAQLSAHVLRQARELEPTWTLVSSEDPGQILLETALQATPARVIYLAHTPQMLPCGPRCFFPSLARTQLLQQVAGIITVSNYLQTHIRRWSGLESVVMRFPVYGSGPYPRRGNFNQGFITLINPCAYKGLAIFLALARALPQVQFAAVPTWGATREEQSVLAQLSNVSILPPTDDIDQIFAQTRVLLVPSLCDEAFGLVAVESMLRGIPVLASNVGGLAEAKLGVDYVLPVSPIERYESRFDDRLKPLAIVPEQDIQPWLETIQALLSNRAHYDQLADASRTAALAFVSQAGITPFETYFERLRPAGTGTPVIPAGKPGESIRKESSLNLSAERRALLALRLQKKDKHA